MLHDFALAINTVPTLPPALRLLLLPGNGNQIVVRVNPQVSDGIGHFVGFHVRKQEVPGLVVTTLHH